VPFLLFSSVALIPLLSADRSSVPISAMRPAAVIPSRSLNEASNNNASLAVETSQNCDESGDIIIGHSRCTQTFSNGAYVETIREYHFLGDEHKIQVLISEYDANGLLVKETSVRKKTLFHYDEANGKFEESSYLDVIVSPLHGRMTRELLVDIYDENSKEAKQRTWTRYIQTGDSDSADLSHHASLLYDSKGKPYKGIAEIWKQGQRADTLLNWSRNEHKFLKVRYTTWYQWENWMNQLASQSDIVL